MNAALDCFVIEYGLLALQIPRSPVGSVVGSTGKCIVQSHRILPQGLIQVAGLAGWQAAWLRFRKKRKALADHLEPKSLVKELMLIELALACGEPERRVPQSRGVYWSKIEVAICKRSVPAYMDADASGFGVVKRNSGKLRARAGESEGHFRQARTRVFKH